MIEENPRILVVDDQPTNLQVVGGVLRDSKKYRVSFAQNGEEALRLVESVSPDLILLDVMMPGMGGFEVCQRIKENPQWSAIPVIFLTAKSEAKDMIEGFGVGGADYITKPFEPAVLMARVATHLKLYLYHQREEEMRSQERISAYQNGLTEMGASVLHNIGNAMVGVNSRISPIQTVVNKLNDLGNALEKGHQMLEQGEERDRVLQILDLGAKLLKEEYAAHLDSDCKQLKESVYHVNEIIDAQRSLTNKGLMSSRFALSSLLSDVSTLLGDELSKRKVELQIEEHGEIPEVFLPRSPLGQMVVNLVKNSYEAIAEQAMSGAIAVDEGRITLSIDPEAGAEQRFWVLEVSDNGVGIPEEELSSVLLSGYTTKATGSGLGLHSAANFAVAMGGELKVFSEGAGRGATIRVQLPMECMQNCYQAKR